MFRRKKQILARLQKALDGLIFCLGIFLAHFLRINWEMPVWAVNMFDGVQAIQPFSVWLWILVVIFPLGPFLLETQGFYQRSISPSRLRLAWGGAKTCAIFILLISFILILTKQDLSRTVIILFAPISWLLLMLKEEGFRYYRNSALANAQWHKRFILVGTKADAQRLVTDLQKEPSNQLKIVAQFDINDHTVQDLVEAMHRDSVNGVLIAATHTYFGQIEKTIQACEVEGVEVWLLADFLNTQFSHTILDEYQNRPILIFRRTPDDSWHHLAKSAIDATGSAIALLLLAPILVLAALMVKILSPGPVFFKQQRSGLNGRPFTMYKFRSMVTNAEQRKQELEVFNEMTGPVFKITNDPRITPLGRFLRKYSIDELPQLFNVLRGDMSLVGPRPLPVEETHRFSDLAHRRRLSVKPGLTCLWQIEGRSNVLDFADWVRLDLEYIDNWSIWLDIKILFRTIPVVVRGSGAK